MLRTKRVICCGMLCVGLLLFCGCGEQVKSLTEEEEDIICMYAAKVVAKHNVRLGQGVMRYRGKIEEEEEKADEDVEEPAEEEAGEESEGTTAGTGSSSSQTGDSSGTEASSPSGRRSTSTSGRRAESSTEEAAPAISEETLSEALGINGIHFVYGGAKVPESLRLSSYYTLPDPQPGKQYVIVSFDAINETQSAAPVSVADIAPKFQATLGGETVNAGMVLDHDLMTYAGTIPAGGSERLILLFTFPEGATSDLSGLNLTADVGGKKSKILLR